MLERVTNTSVTLLGMLLSDTFGILEVLKEEAETSLAGLVCCFKALTPCVRGCGFVIQCTCILSQHICDLGNNQSCGCTLESLSGVQHVGGRAGCCAG